MTRSTYGFRHGERASGNLGRMEPPGSLRQAACTWVPRSQRTDEYGWAWALILSEIAPEQADAILARGRAFGQSRVICNVHWQSDVIEGRFLGAATVAILHADFVFRADLESAKAELATARGKGLKPTRDCEAEAKELAQQPPPAP
jgi:hypothetical protein